MQKRYYLQERHRKKPLPIILAPFYPELCQIKSEDKDLTKWKDVTVKHWDEDALLLFTLSQAQKIKKMIHSVRRVGMDEGEVRIMDLLTKQEVING